MFSAQNDTIVIIKAKLSCLYFRAQTEDMLKLARKDQIQNKEHFLAVQAAQDRAEFERVLE